MIAPTRPDALFPRESDGPLAGVVIADLSRVLAGPYATMLLADMGALVIKVESPRGDDTRTWMPPVRDGEATYFLSANRGKYSIALDFADPAQLRTAREIIARADVLVENFAPGRLDRFGLDYDTLAARHPDLVYASITGFGTEAGADLPGYDLLVQAVSGLMDLTGPADGDPTKVGVAVVDVITGLHAATGILAALHARSATGHGEHIEVNLLSSVLSGLVNQASAVVAGGAVPTRMGNAHPSVYPYEPFPTADRDLVIAVGNDAQFARLCEALGLPELAGDPRFMAMAGRNRHRADLRPLLADRLRTRTADQWFELLRAAQVPCGPIQGIDAGLRLAERLGLDPVVQAGSGKRRIPTVRHPIRYSRSHVDYSQAPPRLDADGDRVRAWLAAGERGRVTTPR
ncbi:CaiB/BaiF CoA transferase family protein [Microbacterium sp.]|uniref:CaiB/BaiF CoA transferase family protein n=1 Tax=Microbacterium sp. TaxID=51671 RepID=UPI003A8A34B9